MSSSFFGKKGLIIGIVILIIEYLFFAIFYSYADSELWSNRIPHKQIAYINLLLVLIIINLFVFGSKDRATLTASDKLPRNFLATIALGLGLCVFAWGTFIVVNIVKANIFNEAISFGFTDHNLSVWSAFNVWNILNIILYPIVTSIVYQGFLLSGVSHYIGISKANIVVSLFYGFWFGDIIGGTVYCLFLNQTYHNSKNILIPILLSVSFGLLFSVAYSIEPDIWMLEAMNPDYNGELTKGILLSIAFCPLAWNVFKKRI